MTPTTGAAELPEALRHASYLDGFFVGEEVSAFRARQIAAELRRLHHENERLAVLVEAQQPAPSAAAATAEVENLRKALVYVAFALHDTPQYMLAQGITLIDGDTVRVSRDGWTVEASVNPLHQPARQPPKSQAADSVTAPAATCPTCKAPCTTTVNMRGGEHGWGTTDLERTVYHYAPAQAADSVLEDAARYRWLVAHCRSTAEHWGGRWSIVVDGPAPELENGEYLIDEAIDAAMAAKKGENHD
jgi:hypothetical protein